MAVLASKPYQWSSASTDQLIQSLVVDLVPLNWPQTSSETLYSCSKWL
jgi:hypothetical protein